MKTAFRTLAGILAGLALSLLLVIAVEFFSAVVHPFPEDFGGTTEEVCRHVERYPQWVLTVVVAAWGATAFVGVWVAGRIGNLCSSASVAALLVAAVVLNISMLPYPIWFKVIVLIAVLTAVLAGIVRSRRKRPASPEGRDGE